MNPVRNAFLEAVVAVVVGGLFPWSVASAQEPAVPAAPAVPAQEQQDPVIAVVGTVEICESELLAELNRQIPLVYYHQKVPQGQMDDLRRKALDKLIEKSLIFQDAVARNLKVTDEEVRATFEKTLAASGEEFEKVSPQKFAKLLEQFRPLVRRKLLIDKNEERFRASVPKPDDEKLKAVYDRLAKEGSPALRTPPEARLRHLFIGVDPAATERQYDEKQAKIDAATKALADGKPFDEVAKQYSEDEFGKDGGDIGFVKQGKFKMRQLDEAAFALKAGEKTDVIRTIYGFHIVQCLEVVPQRLRTIEETRPLLEEWFSTEHHTSRRAAWLAEVRTKLGVKIVAAEFLPPPAATPDDGKKEPAKQ